MNLTFGRDKDLGKDASDRHILYAPNVKAHDDRRLNF